MFLNYQILFWVTDMTYKNRFFKNNITISLKDFFHIVKFIKNEYFSEHINIINFS